VKNAAVALTALALLGGCGGGGDDTPKAKTPKEAFLRYYDAVGDKDAKKACSYTTGPAAATCEKDAKAIIDSPNDPKLLAQNTHTILDSQTFKIRGDLACVTLQRFAFDAQKTKDGWRVLRLRRPIATNSDCTSDLKP